ANWAPLRVSASSTPTTSLKRTTPSPSEWVKARITVTFLSSLPSFTNLKEGQSFKRSTPEQLNDTLTSPLRPWGLTMVPRMMKSSGRGDRESGGLFNDFEGIFQPVLRARGRNQSAQ